MTELDKHFMTMAFDQAKLAYQHEEVPVGAVLVKDAQVIACGYNQPIALNDPTAHAEVLVLRDAAEKLGNYRLVNTTLYVTLEPCMMCLGAMVHARVQRLVFGARDHKSGAICSVSSLVDDAVLNHRVEWCSGVMSDECGVLLKQFFQERRQK